MRLGLFANLEQEEGEGFAAFEAQAELALHAEACGLEELWVSEHHFNSFTQSASILPLIGYFLGITRTIRVGSAAVLTPLHHPIRLAEDIATLDLLAKGRLNIGLARGGPFPAQYQHFGVPPEEAGARAHEATELLMALLREKNVTFKGRWFSVEDLTIYPRPRQEALPVWIASASIDTVEDAGRCGFGLMAGHAWSAPMINTLLSTYRASGVGETPDLVILRNVCVADTDEEAMKRAVPALERFFTRMRDYARPGQASSPVSLDNVLTHAIIGSPETCRRKLADLARAVPIGALGLKIACLDRSMGHEIVRRFREEIVPSEEKLVAVTA
ncbi:LLM class flavin-dependent oxidoreductase [Beijerinckia indica]|uniref:Luciferase-like monooxygenase n=1 Tax=Beijerinckia indica subsp. indica (strain ATCC 9039 / DSM 1715 / NCIMB 8712) TaxID=395963 RepID=B2IG58_BEII9|nr:LLM class flavin-dependent oxidoreductase [Beijerinckia indica]ACB97132.1 Luciferase-like monooxygenase [Beijerinckia indica subsp. indica ATCC 9039]